MGILKVYKDTVNAGNCLFQSKLHIYMAESLFDDLVGCVGKKLVYSVPKQNVINTYEKTKKIIHNDDYFRREISKDNNPVHSYEVKQELRNSLQGLGDLTFVPSSSKLLAVIE